MATNYNILMKRYNGTDWDILRPLTLSDNVDTTGQTNKFATAAQLTAVDDYLTSFNGANQLLKLDANGLIPSAELAFNIDDYLTKLNPSYSGTMTAANGGSNAFNIQDNKILFGYGTPSGSLAKYQLRASGLNLILSHDIGSGYVNSLFIAPTAISINNRRIQEVGTPTNQTDAANKEYVDNLIASGLTWKEPVKAASIGNITLGVALNALDGVTLAAGDRVLLKQQTTASENGVYILIASKIPQKVTDDSTIGDTVFVEGGATNNDTVYHCNATNTWVLVSKTDTYGVITNGGLEKTGSDFGIKAASVTNAMLAGSIDVGTKLSAFAGSDTIATWNDPAMTAASTVDQLTAKLSKLYSSIKLLRGTAAYNTNNSQTIAGAYTALDTKNSTSLSNANPTNTNRISGDIHYQWT